MNRHRTSILAFLVITLTVAAIYLLAGWTGIQFAILPPGNATAVWAASGVAVAAVYFYGLRALGGVAIGAFAVNIIVLQNSAPRGVLIIVVGIIAVGTTLQTGVSALLLRRLTPYPNPFERTRDVIRFIVFSALLACLISPTIAISVEVASGIVPPDHYVVQWLTWYTGDASGVLCAAPFLIVWRYPRLRSWSRRDWVEGISLIGLLVLVSVVVFRSSDPLVYLTLPLIALIAYRLETHGTSLGILVAILIAQFMTVNGWGSFARPDMNESLLLLQGYSGSVEIMGLILAAGVIERRKARDALIEANRTLEEKVALRTREFSAARDAAESTNRAKTLFIARISHDLRTPLNAVKGFSDAMRGGIAGPITPKQDDYLARISGSAERLRTLVDETLDITAMESGRLQLHFTLFDPWRLIEEAAANLETLAHTKDLTLTLEPGAGLPSAIMGDAARIQQILVNLIGNAIKFTERGGITVQAEGEEGGRWSFKVIDTGSGIAPEAIPMLFESYRRLERADAAEGSGLGLYITRQLVTLMGGVITVESEVGHGSTFMVRLPIP